MVRQVETFCGCCKMKVGCIVIAVCRVVITIAASVAVFVIYFNDEMKEDVLKKDVVTESGLVFYMIASIPVSIVTIRSSYWFIRGATSIIKVDVDRMYHYILIQLATIFILLVCFDLICFLLAMTEFYFLCCSFVLLRERRSLLEENGLNDPETPPPQYDSCVINTQPQTTAIHPDDGQSSEIANVKPDTNPSNSDGVETEESPSEIASVESKNTSNDDENEPHVKDNTTSAAKASERLSFKNVGGEPKENLGFESEENLFRNAGDAADHKSIKNDEMVRKENPISGGEPRENLGFEYENIATNSKVNP